MPRVLRPLVNGMISLLGEPNIWRSSDIDERNEMVRFFLDNFTSEDCDLCEKILACINDSPEVRNGIRGVISEYAEDNPGQYQDPIDRTPNGEYAGQIGVVSDDLDCVYGALVDTFEIVLDGWNRLQTIISTVNDLLGFFDQYEILPKWATPVILEGLELAINAGTSVYNDYINDQATADKWVCAAFDSVCERGEPYRLTGADLTKAFDEMAASAPVVGLTEFLKYDANFPFMVSYWARRTDDSCSNDWQLVCNCNPVTWCHEILAVDFPSSGRLENMVFDATEQAYRPGLGNNPITEIGKFFIDLPGNINTSITGVEALVAKPVQDGRRSTFKLDGGTVYFSQPPAGATWIGDDDISPPVPSATEIEYQIAQDGVASTPRIFMYSVRICGSGVNPFV